MAKPAKKSAARMIESAKKAVEKKAKKPAKQAIVKVKAEVLPKATPDEARSRTAYIKSLYTQMAKNWWEIGEEVERAVNDRVPQALDMAFSAWAQDIFGDGWQRIRRAFLAVRAMKNVSPEKRVQVSEGNAFNFRRLPEKERGSAEWLKKAIEMDNEAFKSATDKFIEKKTGIKDPMVKIVEVFGFVTIPASLSGIFKEALVLAGRLNDFDLETKAGRISAAEAMVSDYVTTYTGAQRASKSDSEALDPEL